MKTCKNQNSQGFALISTLLFLPIALLILAFSAQLLFFNKVKNSILEDCFLYSIENVDSSVASSSATAVLNHVLDEKFQKLKLQAPLNIFSITLEFVPVQDSNPTDNTDLAELATILQLSMLSQNKNLKKFTQNFKCGAFSRWKNSKKFYGIIAVKY